MKWLLLLIASALAHDAPSGWSYPPNCCGGNDCKQVACEEVIERQGVYKWKGVLFDKKSTKMSGDGKCHVCIDGEGNKDLDHTRPFWGRCLFLDFGT